MGSISRLEDVPAGTLVRPAHMTPPAYLVTQATLDAIDDYTRSQPTGPSPGRIYKKDLHWSGPPSNWFLYICEADPHNAGCVLHHGRRVIVMDVDDG